MSSDLFDSYESEYTALIHSVRQRLEAQLPMLGGQERHALLQTTDRELVEAYELAEQLEVELLSLPGPQRTRAGPRIRQYKAEVNKLQQEAKRISQGMGGNHEANRRALLGDASGGNNTLMASDGGLSGLEGDQRTRLLSGSERLAAGTQRLEQSHRIAIETESVGASILQDLRSQREQIVNTRNTLMEADSHIDRSQRTLRTMTRRLMTNKMITTGLVVIGASLVILILYVKIFR
ncbi:Vesicle transport V-snare protein [Coemansia sp. RSA 1722]|nr:Vesicle transport V-snare protein [Coemansia sp. RSA 486]KAJ2238176.1 t-SNARE VTI1 [Coemansia sp. RSA 485]KAJ2600582.1 Vesicle transport V-snare protein [Coemansia sp. RSA 1721]KAJ2604891.1 Vesicle transport V-snare protein [Coemansia sp. RSA 1722]KAJ2635848.1 Vesicle transport V-snare protein [Coemansia sp. RSA 1286]